MIEPGYDNLADFLHDVEGPEAGYAMYREGIEFIAAAAGKPHGNRASRPGPSIRSGAGMKWYV